MIGWLVSATALAAWLILATRWFGSDRRENGASLRSHRHALDRLRHADGNLDAAGDPEPSSQAHVRLLSSRPSGSPPTRRSPRAEPATPPQRRVERPAITEAPAEPEPVPPAPSGLADLLPLPPARRRRSLPPGWPRAAIASVLVVALVAAVVLVAVAARDDSSSSVTDDAVEAEPVPTEPTVPSTEPDPEPVPAVRLTGFDGETASYVVSGNGVAVTLAATAPCWIEVTSSTDQVVFQGTVPAGEQPTFRDPSGLLLRLGNPGAVTLQASGVPLELPPEAQDGAPIDIDVRTAAP